MFFPTSRASLAYTGLATKLAALLLTGSIAAGSLRAEAGTWKIDPIHSVAQFSVRHLGISTVRGAFSKIAGTVQYDSADPGKTTLDVTIDVSSIDTRIGMRDQHLRGPEFFDSGKFPTIRFQSKRVENAGSGKLRIGGDLTIRGVAKDTILSVDSPILHDSNRLEAIGAAKVNRKDFGITSYAGTVGNDVSIIIHVELAKVSP